MWITGLKSFTWNTFARRVIHNARRKYGKKQKNRQNVEKYKNFYIKTAFGGQIIHTIINRICVHNDKNAKYLHVSVPFGDFTRKSKSAVKIGSTCRRTSFFSYASDQNATQKKNFAQENIEITRFAGIYYINRLAGKAWLQSRCTLYARTQAFNVLTKKRVLKKFSNFTTIAERKNQTRPTLKTWHSSRVVYRQRQHKTKKKTYANRWKRYFGREAKKKPENSYNASAKRWRAELLRLLRSDCKNPPKKRAFKQKL